MGHKHRAGAWKQGCSHREAQDQFCLALFLHPFEESAATIPGSLSVCEYAAARHHHGAGPLVGHGGRKLQVGGVVGRDPDLDRSGPLVHQPVDPQLEKLLVLQWPGVNGREPP